VYSETLEQHLEHHKIVMSKLIQVGLKLKPSKCVFVCDDGSYLGHIITPKGLKTSNQHITAVQEFSSLRMRDSSLASLHFIGSLFHPLPKLQLHFIH